MPCSSDISEIETSGRPRPDRDQLVLDHLQIATSVAGRYRERGADLQDLVQVARLALVEAAGRYQPEKGDFLSFAMPTITGMLKKYFRDKGWMVRPPRQIQESQRQIEQARSELTQTLGRSPKVTEIADLLDLPRLEVDRAEAARSCFHPISLDAPSSSFVTPAESLAQPSTEFDSIEARVIIERACQQLNAVDRQVVSLRFYEQRTQQEIADLLGMTQMQVSRTLTRILSNMRDSVTSPGGPDPHQPCVNDAAHHSYAA